MTKDKDIQIGSKDLKKTILLNNKIIRKTILTSYKALIEDSKEIKKFGDIRYGTDYKKYGPVYSEFGKTLQGTKTDYEDIIKKADENINHSNYNKLVKLYNKLSKYKLEFLVLKSHTEKIVKQMIIEVRKEERKGKKIN